jgi:LmbE family N-acetylglucosaminyl deacetylase
MTETTTQFPVAARPLPLFGVLSVETILLFAIVRYLPALPAVLLGLIGFPFWFCAASASILKLGIAIRRKHWMTAGGEDILIIASHPDDCVAIAGGYAIQTVALGGKVNVLYTTGGAEGDSEIRKREAEAAWGVIGIQPDAIHFLPHRYFTGFIQRPEIEAGTAEIEAWICNLHPGTIFVPLFEGGNYQHDVTNFMAVRAAKIAEFTGRIWESPEYNFYFSLRTTPEKILCALGRAIPFVSCRYPPEPVRSDRVYHLRMKNMERSTKCRMLARFKTQNPYQLIARFGFEDRYQALHDYDYTKPPFSYEHSLAHRLQRLKSKPLIGKAVSKAVIWTRTIHPDPAVLMTRLPLEIEES